jgi:Cof subfamily protein (haloacid dehalogenase superfamily)
MPHRLVLIASDVDGTLLPLGGLLPSPRLVRAVAAARAAGIHFALVTARTWEQTRPLAQALSLEGDVAICCQGAQIVRIGAADQPPENLRYLAMDPDVVREMIAWARTRDLRPSVVIEGRYTWQAGEALPERMNFGAGGWAEVPDILVVAQAGVLKFMAHGEPARMGELLEVAKPLFAGRATLFRGAPSLIEATALGADKGAGLRWLLEHLGLDSRQTAALGDGENDESLFAQAGYRIAMGEHAPVLRPLAHRHGQGPSRDGAAKAIEWLTQSASLPEGLLIEAHFDR